MHRRFANELDEPSNGNLAGFSGSLVDVQITGGEAVPYSNITLYLRRLCGISFWPPAVARRRHAAVMHDAGVKA